MKKVVTDTIFIIIGTFLLALAVGCFILPYNIVSGGMAGITVLLSPFVPLDEDTIIIILDILFFLMGLALLGKQFALNTFVSSISYPVCLILVNKYFPAIHIDDLLAAIYGGVIAGVGIGICIRHGGSTGGTDVIPLLLEKYFHFPVSKGIMVLDIVTVVLGIWIYDIETVLIGLICVVIDSIVIEKVLTMYEGRSISKRIEIFTDKYQEIISEIHVDLNRGTTLLEAKGGYTNNSRPVILCVVPEKEYQGVIDIVNKYDSQAFVIVSEAYDVHGEGFSFESRL